MGMNLEIRKPKNVGGEPVGDILVEARRELKAGTLSPDLVPSLIDEIPIMAVLATQAKGKTVFSGLAELRLKETDRLKALSTNLNLIGAKVEETKDGLIIDGPTPLKGGEVDSFSDHRIAMSMAVAGLISKIGVTVKGSESVAISFPSFWKIINELCGN